MKRFLFGFIAIMSSISGIFLTPFSLQAADFQSPRSEALGGAGHAAPLLNDSIYLNPSYISFSSVRSVTFNYLMYRGGSFDAPMADYYGNNMNFSLLDGAPDSLFQAGVGYTRRNDSNFIHVGASKKIINDLGAGLGSKFIFPNDGSSMVVDGTLSVAGTVTRWFKSTLIVDNLFESATNRGLYREYIIGTKFNIESIVLIYVDPLWVPSLPDGQPKFGFQSGVEFPFFRDLFLRIGAFHNAYIPSQAERGNGYAAGIGWLAPKLSLDYSLSRATSPTPAITHNFGATVYF